MHVARHVGVYFPELELKPYLDDYLEVPRMLDEDDVIRRATAWFRGRSVDLGAAPDHQVPRAFGHRAPGDDAAAVVEVGL